MVVKAEPRAGRRNGLRAAGLDLFFESVGLVETSGLESAGADEVAVALAQAHGGPEGDGLAERMIHAVGDDKFQAGLCGGERDGERVL